MKRENNRWHEVGVTARVGRPILTPDGKTILIKPHRFQAGAFAGAQIEFIFFFIFKTKNIFFFLEPGNNKAYRELGRSHMKAYCNTQRGGYSPLNDGGLKR